MEPVDQATVTRRDDPISDPGGDRLAAAGKVRRHAAAMGCPVVAPEVEARIVARQVAGERTSVIGRDLKMTPREVHTVLRAHGREHGTTR